MNQRSDENSKTLNFANDDPSEVKLASKKIGDNPTVIPPEEEKEILARVRKDILQQRKSP